MLTLAVTSVAGPAQAHAGEAPADKDAVLAVWTQPAAASFAKWRIARENRAAWKRYGFDWTTDGCT